MTTEALASGRITHANQDGNREFISLLACIGADRTALPPALIYRSDSGTLQDTWVEDIGPNDEAFFAISLKGWSCDMLSLNWLERVFHPYTSQKSGNRRRLLIVDRHSSHINMQFIKKCNELRILLLVLPAHSTHRLQPLDIGLFAPLATYYTNSLNDLMAKSFGMVKISKRAFWSVFLPAWQNAFSKQNIISAFRKTGIWPYNPTPIFKTIIPPKAVLPASQSLKTPMTCLTHRHTQRKFKTKLSEQIVVKLFKANDCLIIKDSINQYIINSLRAIIQNEKKKR